MDAVKELLKKQKEAFQQFKEANNERLDQLEAKGNTDPILEEKVDKASADISKIEKLIEDLIKKANRPGGTGESNPDVEAHEKAYRDFIVKGIDVGLAELQVKALSVGVDADGGFAVPEKLETDVLQLLYDVSPMRQECSIDQVGGETTKSLVDIGGTSSGWVGETVARPETDTPQFAEIAPIMGEIYANPATTQRALDDPFVKVERWLAESVAKEFAKKEGAAFLTGDGTNKPKGILAYTSVTTADATRTFGQLQYKETAAETAVTGDELLDIVYMLKKAYRAGAKWMMNGLTVKLIRKLKDSDGNYLWAPGLVAGQPSSLLGYSISENEDMADVAESATAVMFGDFKQTYTIIDRMGTRTLRDPYTHKPYVHFYTTKRVGSKLMDSNAMKLLTQKASA